MKTLTKILSVTALIVLCVCLFTLTAFAHDATHTVTNTARVEPTCTTNGNIGFTTCSCGKVYEGIYATAASIDDSKEITAAQTIIPALNHQMSHLNATAATCYADGNNECWFCSRCGKYFADSAGGTVLDYATQVRIPALEHKPASVWIAVAETEANCQHEGNIAYWKCSLCGALNDAAGGAGNFLPNIAATVKPKTGHNWGTWETIKNPTNVSPGQRKRVCLSCDAVEYEEIPATGITDAPYGIYYVIAIHDTWLRGEEPLTFESDLVAELNAASGPNANYVGVRVGTDSLYENSWDTFDFWSWDGYVKLGDKTMAGLREGTYRLWIYDKRHPDVYTNSAVFYVVDVPTLEPYSTDKHVVNSSKSLRFVASEEIRPDSVQVGSKKLYDANDFFVSNDRKNITLSADFLNARQTGTYTISALTKDGRTIKTNFYILSTAQASSSPRTGDESQIGLWAAFLLLSGAAIVVMVPKLRKNGVK